jgi:alginate O-acetyltransferase complex protein AlgJ
MKKYGLKYFLFFLPFAAAVCVELFILPIDFFTFRVWETLVTRRSFGILKGPFYPNMTIFKTEEGGDLTPSPICAVKKKDVLWMTDTYGYRKTAASAQRYPVIVVGDSNAVGSGLSQAEMLSEVLEKRLGKGVYPLAPESLKDIFEHGLLKQTKPDIIILESIERSILTGNFKIPKDADFRDLSFWDEIIWSIRLNPTIQSVAMQIDRVFKANMLHYVKARVNAKRPPDTRNPAADPCPILFLQGATANRDIPDEVRHRAAQNIKRYSDFFTGKGIRFIFLPIPNKENIYYRNLGTSKPVFLEKLILELQDLGVEVVDTQNVFDRITHQTSTHLYHRDDTHWNAEGVEVAALLLEELLRTLALYPSDKK